MPRGVPRTTLDNLKSQGARILDALQREISTRERELAELKAEADRWQSVLNTTQYANTDNVPAKKGRRRRRRIDWNATLEALPATFSAKTIEEVTGKPREQVYAAVSRWSKANKVKRGRDGYQKVGASLTATTV